MIFLIDRFNGFEIFIEVRCIDIVLLNAPEMFLAPLSLIVDFNLPDDLEPATFLPNGNGQPYFAPLVFQAISVKPASSSGKLNIIQQDQAVGMHGFIKETRPWHKDGLMGGENHMPTASRITMCVM